MNMRDASALIDPVSATACRLREQRQDSEQGGETLPQKG